MSKKNANKDIHLFDQVVFNAIDFANRSVLELRNSPKHSMIDFCAAIELFLKARLLREHWAALKDWAKKNKKIFAPHDVAMKQEAIKIQNAFPGLIDPTAIHDKADRWIIAMTKYNGYIVVTHETPAKSKRKPPRSHYIPDVCIALKVPCINLLELMRREKWSL
jgi:hypothetical protein